MKNIFKYKKIPRSIHKTLGIFLHVYHALLYSILPCKRRIVQIFLRIIIVHWKNTSFTESCHEQHAFDITKLHFATCICRLPFQDILFHSTLIGHVYTASSLIVIAGIHRMRIFVVIAVEENTQYLLQKACQLLSYCCILSS